MIRSVKWASPTFLNCACEKMAPVILCVDPDLVAEQFCPVSSEEFEPGYSHVTANITSYCKKGDVWHYRFQYDDSQLIEGVGLQFEDIDGAFCDDCKAQWAREQAGEEMYLTSEDGENYLLYTPHGCEYSFPKPGGLSLDFLFGTGSDGDLTVLNTEDLILPNDPLGRSFFFNDLTIDEGGILMPLGERFDGGYLFYQIFVNGTLTINGTLHADANNGANGVGATPGAAGGASIGYQGPGGHSICGADGGRGTSGAGASQAGGGFTNVGSDCTTIAGFMSGGEGGAGGAGGDGSAGGTIEDLQDIHLRRLVLRLTDFSAHASQIADPIYGGTGGAGGGGGGRTGTAEGGAGGGGGGGAGTIWIAARNIVVGATGVVSANGGDGGNGADGTPGGGGDTAGGGGGGGAGGGGLIYLVYENLTNNGTMQVDPGSAGLGGAAIGAGTVGTGGAAGAAGQIVLLNMRTGLFE